jgi:hypothetical protein
MKEGLPARGDLVIDPVSVQERRKVQTVEATGKSWKGAQLIGGAMMALGLVSCFGVFGDASESDKKEFARNGWLFFFGGGAVWLWGRVGGWWHHG